MTERGGDPQIIGEIIWIIIWAVHEDFQGHVDPEELANKIWKGMEPRFRNVTKAAPKIMAWWEKVFIILCLHQDPHATMAMEESLEYAEKCADPRQRWLLDLGRLNNPGGYIASKVIRYARRNSIRLPRNPLST